KAVLQHLDRATIVVKAAAVADYRTKQASSVKIKGKRDLNLELTPNPDILAEVAARGTTAFVVGFAAETHDVAEHARAKLESKGLDLLLANYVSQQGIGFDAEDSEGLPQVQALRGALDGRVRLREPASGIRRHRRGPGRGRGRPGAALCRARRAASHEDARSPEGRAVARRRVHYERGQMSASRK